MSDIPQREFWEFINSFAPWLSGLGTLLVVAVSLHLARRDEKIRLRISVESGYYLSFTSQEFIPLMKFMGMDIPPPNTTEVLWISVVNIGRRAAKISQVAFSIPYRKGGITIGGKNVGPVPCDLTDGQTADYRYPQEKLGELAKNVSKIIRYPIESRLLQVVIVTSVGVTFKKRIPKSIADILAREITALRNTSSPTN